MGILNVNQYADAAAKLGAKYADALLVCNSGAAYLDTLARFWTFLDEHPAMLVALKESNEFDAIYLEMKAYLAK